MSILEGDAHVQATLLDSLCPARTCASGSDISLPQAAAAVRLDFPSSHPSGDLDRMQGVYTPSKIR
jgi:hypothetical protein